MKFKPNPLLYGANEDFSLTFMQSGKGEKYLNAFIKESCVLDIPARLVGEERYKLCNTSLLV